MTKNKLENKIEIYNKKTRKTRSTEIAITKSENCGYTLKIENKTVYGDDIFDVIRNARLLLESTSEHVLIKASRPDAHCGGMLRKSTNGLYAYAVREGRSPHIEDAINILDDEKLENISTVEAQDQYIRNHRYAHANRTEKWGNEP